VGEKGHSEEEGGVCSGAKKGDSLFLSGESGKENVGGYALKKRGEHLGVEERLLIC